MYSAFPEGYPYEQDVIRHYKRELTLYTRAKL